MPSAEDKRDFWIFYMHGYITVLYLKKYHVAVLKAFAVVAPYKKSTTQHTQVNN